MPPTPTEARRPCRDAQKKPASLHSGRVRRKLEPDFKRGIPDEHPPKIGGVRPSQQFTRTGHSGRTSPQSRTVRSPKSNSKEPGFIGTETCDRLVASGCKCLGSSFPQPLYHPQPGRSTWHSPRIRGTVHRTVGRRTDFPLCPLQSTCFGGW